MTWFLSLFAWVHSILSMSKVLAVSTWQTLKMFGRLYALVIPATVSIAMNRTRKRSKGLDRYRVECGAWTLRATIRRSGRSLFLSSLSLTKRAEDRGSISTVTTRKAMEAPLMDASSPPDPRGRQFEP